MRNGALFRLRFDKITRREKRERLLFLVKLVVFIGLIYLWIRNPAFDKNLGWNIRIVDAVLIFVTTYLIISFSRLTLVYLYIKRKRQSTDFMDNFILGINYIASILTLFALIASGFVLLNIQAQAFFTTISIVAAAIAILSKDYISNMINGMIIMFSDQLSLYDDVKIGEQKGKIVDITLINVHLLNDNEDLVYIPNTTIFTTNVINYTKYNVNKITIEFELNRDYASNVRELEAFVQSDLTAYTSDIEPDTLRVRIARIYKDNVLLRLQLVLSKQTKEIEDAIRNRISERILQYIDEVRQAKAVSR